MGQITINNAMGGITNPFLDTYKWTDAGSQVWTVNYTATNAGGSSGMNPTEGWTVGGDAWGSGEPEIFYDPWIMLTWRAYNPDDPYGWYYFDSFVNGTDGTGGLKFTDGMGSYMTFLPAAPDPPTSVTASDGEYDDKVRLDWDFEEGKTYSAYRSEGDDPESADQVGSGIDAHPWDDTTGTPWTLYNYWMKAHEGGDSSDFSDPDTGWAKDSESSNETRYASSVWDGYDDARPPTTHTQDTESVVADFSAINTDDSNYIEYTTPSDDQYPGHRVRIPVQDATIHQLEITVKALGTGSGNNYTLLHIWNVTNSEWDALDTHESASKDTVFGRLLEPSDYIIEDGGTFVDLLVIGAGEVYPWLRCVPGADLSDLYSESTSGTAINSATDLQNMKNDLSATYYLAQDIDASGTASWNGGAGFEPVGNTSTPFTGTLHGNGHTVTGLTINRPGTNYVGLFGEIGQGGAVYDVGLLNASIEGNSYVGGMAGNMESNTEGQDNWAFARNCYVTGSVTGTAVGGFVGRLYDNARCYYCHSTATVTGDGNYVGGFCGVMQHCATGSGSYRCGTIGYSYASGNVTVSGSQDYVGGFIGFTDRTVLRSYATGNVTAGSCDYVGGFIGKADGWIGDCYACGAVSGSDRVGGFVGYQVDDVLRSYSTGAPSGSTNVGGFCGDNTASITDCFWDTETSGTGSSDGGTGKTTAQMKQKATFPTWNFSTIWMIG